MVFLSFFASCSLFKPTAPKPVPKPEKPIEPPAPKEEPEKVEELKVNTILLLLPFQLDKIRGNVPVRSDVKRSEMPLDFYQGFKMALDKLALKGNNFQLKTVDTRDNVAHMNAIAKSPEVQSADLLIGPIYPKEIQAFAQSAKLGYNLQVSPLAASAPSSFNIANLVSLTPSINQHADGLAQYLKKVYRKNDRIIVLNGDDEESLKFINPIKDALKEVGKNKLEIIEVSDLDALEEEMSPVGKNYFVTGKVNKYAVDAMLVKLTTLMHEGGFSIHLVGHPLWAKSSYQNTNLHALNAVISTSSHLDFNDAKVRDFRREYQDEFKVEPSEFAFKGFDTGHFFGSLLEKYGANYTEFLLKEKYKGLQSNYVFEYHPQWGYVNTFIQILQFDGYQYQPID